MIKTICYVSALELNVSAPNLKEMFSNIKNKNISTNISGVLLYKNENFLQIIEGEEKTVNALFSKIKKDNRHSHIITLIDFPIPQRLFKEYKTSFSIVKSSNEFNALFEYIDWLKHADSSCAIKAIKVLETFIKN